MSQAYSDPERASDPYSLPDIEVFEVANNPRAAWPVYDENGEQLESGWYWQACFPGCLPDGYPNGPFASEAEALADARDE